LNYRFFVADDALSAFAATTRRESALLFDHCRHLVAFPNDFDQTWEIDGFSFYSRRFGPWDITCRIDGAVKKVLIVAIEKITPR
jgi:hypothetical protein